ncbi:MAG: hypothetical protein JOZ41_07595 [Chloroflexi bacterium]|nr:hypothetical protein [Chloroflexota bacterium]
MPDDETSRINIGYPLAQLFKAEASPSPEAATRVARWRQVVAGLLSGSLKVGTRTPVADVPPWVTLEVVTGGFATGNQAAGGPLQPHEVDRLVAIPHPPRASQRAALNLYFMSDQGAPELAWMLETGRYRLTVPEEGTLLVAVWLSEHGEGERAAALLDTVMPFFDRLRFYPVPHDRPTSSGSGVHCQTVAAVVSSLRAKRPKPGVAAMNEAIQVWTPLYDQAVALVAETVDGELPCFERDPEGTLVRGADGQSVVVGGRPCRRFPPDWRRRAQALLAEYAAARARHQLSGRPENPKSGFARLRGIIQRCTDEPASLTAGDAEMARRILAGYVARFGGPGHPRLREVRAAQRRDAALPPHHLIGRVVADRLAPYPADEGVAEPAPLTGGVMEGESRGSGIPAGTPLPREVVRKAMRCFQGSLQELVERRIVTSAEAMAPLLSTVTAQTRAASIADAELRRLFGALYIAFRRRRSLLLLDLEAQVKFEELPWVAAVRPWVGSSEASRQAALQTLARAARLTLTTFPQTTLPNKLIRELDALQRAAGLGLPLVEELAADIFMGTFSEKFLLAGKAAGRLLRGTLYERYYDIPYSSVLELDDVVRPERGTPTSPGFAALCQARGAPAEGSRWSVARNGTVIEQAQIITTHNLAVLFAVEDERAWLEPELPDLARACFRWVCRRLQVQTRNWRADMQGVKDAAFAWRQMVFFLSLVDPAEVASFEEWANGHLRRLEGELQARFAPVMAGFTVVAHGGSLGAGGYDPASGGRRFLGWTVGRHWLLEAPERAPRAQRRS